MNYSLLTQLIQHLADYEKGHSSQKLEDFIIWLNNQLFSTSGNDVHNDHNELMIPFQLIHLNKSLKKQVKHILTSSKVASIDEYSFLLHLAYQDSFRKMEIIELHNLEAPTGIEIIKRLLANGLIEAFPDEQDKRAKRIKLTPAGSEELDHLKPNVDQAFKNFSNPLSLEEKIRISGILNKLMQ